MLTIRQIKAARALLGWSQADLARHSGISEPTIARLEAVDGELGDGKLPHKKLGMLSKLPASNFLKIMEEAKARAFASQGNENSKRAAGVEFIDENGGGPGVRLRKQSRQD